MKNLIGSFVVIAVIMAWTMRPSAYGFDVYVSNAGTDAGVCTPTAPCATFAYAFTQFQTPGVNGVIRVMNAGNYGSVVITHGVTIDGGDMASNTVNIGLPVASIFRVAAGTSDTVTIKNLTISGINGIGGNEPSAIAVTSVGALHVENCTFVGFGSAAIDFRATGALLDMKNVTITDMPNANGVYVANARATLEHVSISRTQTAVLAAGSSTVSIAHSTVNGNASGFVAAYGPTAEIHIDDCTMTNNQWAVVAGQGATAYVSRSSLTNNVIAALFNDGTSHLISYGDNRFASNASDGAFTGMASMK